ncbi:sensor domain-containing diguanylate cyclase [Vibrio natriegens]|uniref:sensor domain-containing diguanylate cyclase n=2 Tax=Vibrio natriegens TaxID=691 RepID=UPI0021E726AA|nr:sensor domain-containing diguanylate cyclase [Vibrio natriegens]UYI45959.1 sensor domain-containing diguanylate cyclase [Vibrio natriegens]
MQPPKIPDNEAERLHALRALEILDTTHEERFDRVTRMAKRMFGVPISLVSLIDENRQWFKSAQGLEVTETPRAISFCGHAINNDGLFIIPNAIDDKRFCDNPLVTDDPNIRFYAGYPLKLRQGINIGTLCLIDSVPREMDEEDRLLLQDLGAMIEQEIQSVQMATLDELTMISNRRGFLLLADHTLKMCKRKSLKSSILVFDLNKFKPINDTYGHHEGDYVLKEFAMSLLETFRECDVIGRWGGDEFVVFLTDTESDSVTRILARFRDKIVKLNQEINKPYRIEYSCGVSHYSYDSPLSIEKRIEDADNEMYKEKRRANIKR